MSVSTQTNKEHRTQCFLTEMNTWSWCLVIESDCWSLQYGLVQKMVMIKIMPNSGQMHHMLQARPLLEVCTDIWATKATWP